jgi:HlyD family secretion protein
MSRRRKWVVGLLVLGVLMVAAAVVFVQAQDRSVEVRIETVQERDLVALITATGNVRARRQVNISSDVMGRVVELNVEEGDDVDRDQVLLRIDPSQIQASVARNRAALSQARSQVAQHRANLIQSERELQRIREMRDRDPGLVSVQRLQEAETAVDVQRSLLESAEHGVEQALANLEEAEDQLGRTTIRAPIAGRVTRLNIEEGETVVVGTMNNPGSLLLTISDLSAVEAVLAVDETNVPRVSLGDSATVEMDAFPGRGFPARVSRIGNSAIQQAGTGSGGPTTGSSVDYEVILTLADPPQAMRPDLSATADIIVEARAGVPAVPIIAVTTRDDPDEPDVTREGVFLVQDGTARFQEVELGITGRDHFEVVQGLSVGDSIVAGPFRAIQELQDGMAVRTPSGTSGGR